MKCVAVCKDVLFAKALHRALTPSLDLEFLLADRTVARRLHDAGLPAHVADPRRVDSYVKADVTPATIVIIEDNGKRGLRRILRAVIDAGATLVYVLSVEELAGSAHADDWKSRFPEVTGLSLGDLLQGSLLTALGRSLTRARVQQYQRYFTDADRVLILLHNDPDPDAMASGPALRNLLHRTKTTAIIGAFQGVTRPENLRMANLLDISVGLVTAELLTQFDRIATVDVQPHYYGGLLKRVDLVVDHHPEQTGYMTTFKDIRADYGSTSTILTEHLRAVDVNISERTATAFAVCDQVGHALSQSAHESSGSRGLYVPLPAGRCGARAKNGGFRDHARAAGLRHPAPDRSARRASRSSPHTLARCHERTSSPTLPIFSSSWRVSSGPSCRVW